MCLLIAFLILFLVETTTISLSWVVFFVILSIFFDDDSYFNKTYIDNNERKIKELENRVKELEKKNENKSY